MKSEIEVQDNQPLRWPEGWQRKLISERKPRATWKKPFSFYREQVVAELKKLGATRVEITRNPSHQERMDPGVAVWYSVKPHDDFSWQVGLQLDSPIPSIDEIDAAFRRLAQKHHPDAVARGSGGDVEMFHRLDSYRKKARSYVLGESAPKMDNCIPVDSFTEIRYNLAGVAAALRHFRGLELLGMPAILERVMDTAFKTALPGHQEGKRVVAL